MKKLLIVSFMLIGCTNAWSATPLFDPFIQNFQVGKFSSPDEVVIADGFPAGIIEPPVTDRYWVQAAESLLSPELWNSDSGFLTYRLINRTHSEQGVSQWLAATRNIVDSLRASSGIGDTNNPLLLSERYTVAAFNAVAEGRIVDAGKIASLLKNRGAEFGLPPRAIFIWDLRSRLFKKIASAGAGQTQDFWNTMFKLGPWDSGNAWALWVAVRKAEQRPILSKTPTTKEAGMFLGKLGNSRLSLTDIHQSGFGSDMKAGLGASLLKKQELQTHLQKYPQPPANFTLHGWWVKGKRFANRGQAEAYEQLARNSDLNQGWAMDVWRRASEVRLLAGNWNAGLANLDQALKISAQGKGTRSLRRRLRHWVEQAMVLALAQGNKTRAQLILKKGKNGFTGEELTAYRKETDYWRTVLEHKEKLACSQAGTSLPARASCRVESGEITSLQPLTEDRRNQFVAAADQPLWDIWYKWGVALCKQKELLEAKSSNAHAYLQILQAGHEVSPTEQENLAIKAVGSRFNGRSWFHKLTLMALDHDIGQINGWASAPRESYIPNLARELKSSRLDLHALLGFALAVGDMRGTLAVATLLEGRGITSDQKRRFLYPLPHDGAIKDALLAANSDPALLLAVARNESLFESAVRSRAGALGWMQIMPFHLKESGALPGKQNWSHPSVSIAKGDQLLKENRQRYHGDPYRTLAAYNAGPGAANRWTKQLGGDVSSDIYLAWIGYTETRHYVEKVLIDREIYNWIINGVNTK